MFSLWSFLVNLVADIRKRKLTSGGSDNSLTNFRYVVPLVGDQNIILALINGKTWNLLFQLLRGEGLAWAVLFRNLLIFTVLMLAYSVRPFFRTGFGSSTTGWLFTFLTACFLLALNYKEIYPVLAPLAAIFGPIREVIACRSSTDGIYSWWPDVLEYTRSVSLTFFFIGFCVLSIGNLFLTYATTIRDNASTIQRGFFWPLLLIKTRALSISDFRWVIVEAMITTGIGAFFLYLVGDTFFGQFLIVAGLCHLLIEGIEFIYRHSPGSKISA